MILLLCISVALVAGLMMTRLFKQFHLPDVTSYLIAGVLLGPCLIGRLGLPGVGFSSFELVDTFQPISDVALGFIAFAIGSEFRLSSLRTTGRAAVIVGIFQAVAATLLVDAALLALHLFLGDKLPVSAAITLGAIAAATAPAATLMVVRQYKAKGPLTDILLPVVALDDAVGLVIFAISFGAAQAMESNSASIASIAVEPLLEIVLSLALGALLGWVLTLMERWFLSNRNRVAMIAGFVVAAVALSMVSFEIAGLTVKFSSLLVCMMLGTVFCNTCPNSEDLMGRQVVRPAADLVLCAQRRRAAPGCVHRPGCGGHWAGVHSGPLSGQILWGYGQQPHCRVRSGHSEISGHYPAAAGRRCPGNGLSGGVAGRDRLYHSQHCAVRRAHL